MPRTVAPSRKRTVPAGTDAPDDVGTVAVKVTDTPGTTLAAEALSVMLDVRGSVMVSDWMGAFMLEKTLSPL